MKKYTEKLTTAEQFTNWKGVVITIVHEKTIEDFRPNISKLEK